jgi:hypothetical protein
MFCGCMPLEHFRLIYAVPKCCFPLREFRLKNFTTLHVKLNNHVFCPASRENNVQQKQKHWSTAHIYPRWVYIIEWFNNIV